MQIFLQFLSFQCEVSGQARLRRPDDKVTHPDACGLSHAYVAMYVRTG